MTGDSNTKNYGLIIVAVIAIISVLALVALALNNKSIPIATGGQLAQAQSSTNVAGKANLQNPECDDMFYAAENPNLCSAGSVGSGYGGGQRNNACDAVCSNGEHVATCNCGDFYCMAGHANRNQDAWCQCGYNGNYIGPRTVAQCTVG